MSEDRKPRIDVVTAEYERRGTCSCGRKIKRTRTFKGPTLEDCEKKANEWTEPLRHKECKA